MRCPLAALVLLASISTGCGDDAGRPAASSTGGPFSHARFGAVLERYVDGAGMVDYPRLAASDDLDPYVASLAASSPASHPERFPTEADAVAYWMNAYNALMLHAVSEHYPVGSVTEIADSYGVFDRLTFDVGGRPMTLDAVEKGTLLVEFDEPRVHFGLTCASMGCPRLGREPFVPDQLDAQLDAATHAYLGSDIGAVVDVDAGRVWLSRYFDWYRDDFPPDPVSYVRPYLTDARRERLDALGPEPRIEFIDYDWRLNDATAAWAVRAP